MLRSLTQQQIVIPNPSPETDAVGANKVVDCDVASVLGLGSDVDMF